jgi:hypothetical protein
MAKYRQYAAPPPKRRKDIHPIWRGLGCLIILIIPVISYAGASVLMDTAWKQKWPLPNWMYGYPVAPKFITQVQVLRDTFAPLLSFKDLYGLAIFTLLLMVVLYGLYSVIYAILYNIVGPPRYSHLDAPPPKVKPKPYKR